MLLTGAGELHQDRATDNLRQQRVAQVAESDAAEVEEGADHVHQEVEMEQPVAGDPGNLAPDRQLAHAG